MAFVAQFLELDAAQHLVERAGAPHGFFGQFRSQQVEVRTGLGRCGAIARYRALRNRDLTNRHDRRTVATVQHVQAALFGRCDQRRLDAVGGFHVQQGWLAANVHVPQVVVGELVVPAHLAGGQVQGHQAGAVFFGARGAVGAPLVWSLVAQWQVDHAEFFIDAGQRPHVRRVAAVVFARWQWLGGVRVVAVPVPHQVTVVDVESTDHAGRLVGRLVVGNVAAHDHQVTGDGGWRGGVVAARGERADTGGQVDHALVAEAFADLAGVGVQGNQARVGGWQVQAARARLGHGLAGVGDHGRRRASGCVGVFVIVGNATAGHVGETLEADRALDLRVEAPDFLAGVRVQRQHLAVGGAGIEHAVDLERGVVVGQLDRVASGWQVAGADAPGFLQRADVVRGDLLERRVAVTELGAAIGLPVAVRHGRCGVGGVGTVAPQLTEHFARVGELAAHSSGAGQDHGHAQGGGAQRRRALAQQRTAEPRQQQDDAEGEPQRQPRHQLPPVQAHFPQRPGGTGQQHQCIQAQGCTTAGQQQNAGQRQADTGQQVVQRAAKHAQLDPPGQQGQAH